MEYDNVRILFPVSELNIQLDTNVGNVVLFNRGMIKLPKMTDAPQMTSDMPLFTRYVKYPSSIQDADWKTRFEFFFNREVFTDTLRQAAEEDMSIFKSQQQVESDDASETNESSNPVIGFAKPTGEKWLLKTEKHNIMITLRSIFPISDAFGTALKNSYDHILLKRSNGRVMYDLDVKNALNFFGFMYKFGIINKEEEEYFLNIGGKRYSIEDVMWENDIVNHPIYAEFLKTQRATFDEAEILKLDVEKQLDEFVDKLNDKIEKLIELQKYKRHYILDVFQNIPNVKKLMAQECSSVGEDQCELKNATQTFRSFDRKFKTANQSYFDKFLRDGKVLYEEIKLELAKDSQTEDERSEEKSDNDLLINWESYPSDTKDDAIKYLIAQLKNPDTIDGMIATVEKKSVATVEKKSDTKRENDRNSNRQYELEPILEKLNALNDIQSSKTRDDADNIATLILSMQNEIDMNLSGLVKTAFSEYETLFVSLVELAINVKAGLMAYQFVNDQKPMNLKPPPSDGKTENTVNRKLNEAVQRNFKKEMEMNDKLSNSVNNIYEPVRKTSNTKLYCSLRNLKTGQFPADCEMGDDLDTSPFKQIYEYYMAETLKRKSFEKIKPYLYTGLDQVQSSNDNKKSSSTGKPYEIYVRVDLVDADKFETLPRSACKLFDKIITEEYQYLTDKKYTDGTILSKFRNLDFDSVIPNPMSDVKNATISDTMSNEVQNHMREEETNGGNAKMRTHMKYTRRFRKNGKKRTLRA